MCRSVPAGLFFAAACAFTALAQPSVIPPAAVQQPPIPQRAPELSRDVPVARLIEMELYNTRGEELGEVERVILDQNGQMHIVVESGGFLGIGDREVAIPLSRVALRGERLVTYGITEDEIRSMPEWDENDLGVPGGHLAPLTVIMD